MAHLEIGEGVESIGSWAFADCNNIVYIVCKPTMPPKLGGDLFNFALNVKINIPNGCEKAYLNSDWRKYLE